MEQKTQKFLNEDEKSLIDKTIKESKLGGAVHLRLYIKKYYGRNIPHNKIHDYLLKQGIAQEDEEKRSREFTGFMKEIILFL